MFEAEILDIIFTISQAFQLEFQDVIFFLFFSYTSQYLLKYLKKIKFSEIKFKLHKGVQQDKMDT